MLDKVKIGKWLLEINHDKTKQYYEKGIEVCDCLYCVNYMEQMNNVDSEFNSLFQNLGINPTMPAQLAEFPAEEEGKHHYIGHYHFVGRIIEGEISTASNSREDNSSPLNNFNLSITEELEFVPNDFPTPILQLDFSVDLPWKLKEKP